jgi:hypothetical protein
MADEVNQGLEVDLSLYVDIPYDPSPTAPPGDDRINDPEIGTQMPHDLEEQGHVPEGEE